MQSSPMYEGQKGGKHNHDFYATPVGVNNLPSGNIFFFQLTQLGQSNSFKPHSQTYSDNTLYIKLYQMAHFPLMHHRCVNKHPEATLQEVKPRRSTSYFSKVEQTPF
ncbi:hypothetical protein EYF80_004148 [Liparis tanakae]|uniref:Uncharacterized protein n=1 Tax=Liparis tanakae TaxID=230148 RepID=A0A4Z2J558_9TELE|nr:hypothetical protein EYF80_004148 [Liparis tanakae]